MTRFSRALRRHRVGVAVTMAWFVLANVVAVVWLAQSPRMYEADKDVFVATSSTDLATTVQRGFFSLTRVQSYTALAKREPLLREVIAQVDPRLTVSDLASRVTATVPPQTVLLRISVEDTRPSRAAALATAIAQAVAEQSTGLEREGEKSSDQLRLVPMSGVEVSDRPVSPQWGSSLLLTELAALALALGTLALWAGRTSRFVSGGDLSASTGLINLAGVRRVQLAELEQEGAGAESAREDLRILRTQLLFAAAQGQRFSVVLVPVGPQDQLAPVAAGLALALAETSASVLLVDGDLRGRQVTRLLGLEEQPGLSDAVALATTPSPTPSSTTPSFHVLGAGHPVPSPTDVLGARATDDLVRGLRERFDVVVVAAPPAAGNVDAALWGRQVDAAVLVVRASGTRRAELVETERGLALAGVRTLGVVLVER